MEKFGGTVGNSSRDLPNMQLLWELEMTDSCRFKNCIQLFHGEMFAKAAV